MSAGHLDLLRIILDFKCTDIVSLETKKAEPFLILPEYIEAANLAPRWNPQLAMLHEKELTRGNRNRATLAIARKLVIYMLAVDRRGKPFITEKESLVA